MVRPSVALPLAFLAQTITETLAHGLGHGDAAQDILDFESDPERLKAACPEYHYYAAYPQ